MAVNGWKETFEELIKKLVLPNSNEDARLVLSEAYCLFSPLVKICVEGKKLELVEELYIRLERLIILAGFDASLNTDNYRQSSNAILTVNILFSRLVSFATSVTLLRSMKRKAKESQITFYLVKELGGRSISDMLDGLLNTSGFSADNAMSYVNLFRKVIVTSMRHPTARNFLKCVLLVLRMVTWTADDDVTRDLTQTLTQLPIDKSMLEETKKLIAEYVQLSVNSFHSATFVRKLIRRLTVEHQTSLLESWNSEVKNSLLALESAYARGKSVNSDSTDGVDTDIPMSMSFNKKRKKKMKKLSILGVSVPPADIPAQMKAKECAVVCGQTYPDAEVVEIAETVDTSINTTVADCRRKRAHFDATPIVSKRGRLRLCHDKLPSSPWIVTPMEAAAPQRSPLRRVPSPEMKDETIPAGESEDAGAQTTGVNRSCADPDSETSLCSGVTVSAANDFTVPVAVAGEKSEVEQEEKRQLEKKNMLRLVDETVLTVLDVIGEQQTSMDCKTEPKCTPTVIDLTYEPVVDLKPEPHLLEKEFETVPSLVQSPEMEQRIYGDSSVDAHPERESDSKSNGQRTEQQIWGWPLVEPCLEAESNSNLDSNSADSQHQEVFKLFLDIPEHEQQMSPKREIPNLGSNSADSQHQEVLKLFLDIPEHEKQMPPKREVPNLDSDSADSQHQEVLKLFLDIPEHEQQMSPKREILYSKEKGDGWREVKSLQTAPDLVSLVSDAESCDSVVKLLSAPASAESGARLSIISAIFRDGGCSSGKVETSETSGEGATSAGATAAESNPVVENCLEKESLATPESGTGVVSSMDPNIGNKLEDTVIANGAELICSSSPERSADDITPILKLDVVRPLAVDSRRSSDSFLTNPSESARGTPLLTEHVFKSTAFSATHTIADATPMDVVDIDVSFESWPTSSRVEFAESRLSVTDSGTMTTPHLSEISTQTDIDLLPPLLGASVVVAPLSSARSIDPGTRPHRSKAPATSSVSTRAATRKKSVLENSAEPKRQPAAPASDLPKRLPPRSAKAIATKSIQEHYSASSKRPVSGMKDAGGFTKAASTPATLRRNGSSGIVPVSSRSGMKESSRLTKATTTPAAIQRIGASDLIPPGGRDVPAASSSKMGGSDVPLHHSATKWSSRSPVSGRFIGRSAALTSTGPKLRRHRKANASGSEQQQNGSGGAAGGHLVSTEVSYSKSDDVGDLAAYRVKRLLFPEVKVSLCRSLTEF